jgi:hypothetical protein
MEDWHAEWYNISTEINDLQKNLVSFKLKPY